MSYADGLVSVIIPFYNGNAFIDDALQSVNNQTYEPVEVIIIVDSGSEFPAWKGKYSNVKVINNNSGKRGPGICRHIGIMNATGRYLAFLDCDDYWLPDKLKTQIKFMGENKFAFSFTSYVDFDSNRKTKITLEKCSYTMENFLNKKFTVGNSTVVLDRSFVKEIRRPTLSRRNDYEMWYFILKNLIDIDVQWGGINEILCYRRLHDNNLTKNKFTSLYYTYMFYATIFDNRIAVWVYFIRSTVNTLIRKFLSRLSELRKDS